MYLLELLGAVRQGRRHPHPSRAGALCAELRGRRASRRPHRGRGKTCLLPLLL